MKFVDFLKPRWKHSDPRIRTEAIREMESEYHLEDLVFIAIGDDLVENQKLALKKISDEGALVRVSRDAREKVVKDIAQQKLNEIWVKQIKTGKDIHSVFQVLEKVSEPKYLEDICLSDTRMEVKSKCLENLENPASFYKIAMREKKPESALQALARVVKPVQLETLAKKATSKAVRAACMEKMQNLNQGQSEQSGEKVISAKLELLCSTLESSQNPTDWEQACKDVKEAEEAWNSIVGEGREPAKALTSRFSSLQQTFWDAYNERQAKQLEKTRQEKELQSNLAAKQEICDTLDELMGKKQSQERNEQIQQLVRKWESVGHAGEEHHERLGLLFQRLTTTFRKEQEEIKRVREQEEKLQAESKTSEQKATELLQRAETLLEAKDPETGKLQLQAVQEDWNALGTEGESFQAQFEELKERILQALENLTQKRLAEQEQLLEKLKALVPKMEALLDSPDILSAEKESRILLNSWKELDRITAPQEAVKDEYQEVKTQFDGACERFKEAQEWYRWANLNKKQEICQQLETALSEDIKVEELFAKMRELQKDWKSIGPMSWDSSKDVWNQYRRVTDDIYEKCKDVFSELEEERQENLTLKKKLCQNVQQQASAENWREAADIVKSAQSEWKNIGPVPREQSEELWNEFRTACDAFFTARKAHFEELGKDKDQNLVEKEKLCAHVESHQEDTNWKEATVIFKKAQDDWKSIGPVPKENVDELWNRFRRACDYFFSRREEFFQHLEGEKGENLQKKESLCEQVEKLDELTSDSEKFNLIKRVQAEWKTIGPVEKQKAESIWERFRKPIDSYFDGRKEKFEEDQQHRQENLLKKEQICDEAVELAESRSWRETSEKLKGLQATWKSIGPAPRDKDREVWNRFRTACDTFFSNMKDHYRQLDDQRELNLRAKEDLCYQAEVLAGFDTSKSEGEAKEESDSQQPDWQEASRQIKELQKKWKQTGPVPKSRSDELWFRFRKACDYVFDYVRGNEQNEPVDLEGNLQQKMDICEEAERISRQVHTDAQIQKIKDLQREWKHTGPIPVGEHGDLWDRFKKACDLVFSEDERLRE